jgi:hypothetical protein
MHRWKQVLVVVAGLLAMAIVSTMVRAGDQARVLSGTFYWGDKAGNTHPIKATLTPDQVGQWKVVYDFTWDKSARQYTGVIKGSLTNGEVTGTASNENGKRTWEIKGTAKGGVLTFDHWETTNGKRARTGGATLQ